MYIAECAPVQWRGQLVTLNNMFIAGGQLVAAVIAGLFSNDKVNGWRSAYIVACLLNYSNHSIFTFKIS